MNKIKVACLFGGCSSEYEVSLVSATSVIRNIDLEKYEPYFIGITREGDFYWYTGDINRIEIDEWFDLDVVRRITFSTNRSDHGFIVLDTNELYKVDIVLPILHGKNGEDGTIQGLLELAGIPYVGCNMTSSAICMDKFIAHELVRLHNIKVPKSYLFDKDDIKIKEKVKDLNYPIFVKPLKAGSSFGITKVTGKQELDSAIALAFTYDNKIIIEEGINGFEVGCAVLGNKELIVGEVDEIELESGFFDYEEKYTLKTSMIHLPARISVEERKKIKEIALQIYQILGCSGFARVDLFYTDKKEIIFNEVNTIPGCTSHSRYPSMLKEIGYEFQDVIEEWIRLGLER